MSEFQYFKILLYSPKSVCQHLNMWRDISLRSMCILLVGAKKKVSKCLCEGKLRRTRNRKKRMHKTFWDLYRWNRKFFQSISGNLSNISHIKWHKGSNLELKYRILSPRLSQLIQFWLCRRRAPNQPQTNEATTMTIGEKSRRIHVSRKRWWKICKENVCLFIFLQDEKFRLFIIPFHVFL